MALYLVGGLNTLLIYRDRNEPLLTSRNTYPVGLLYIGMKTQTTKNKTYKIEGTGTIIDIGSSCVGCMAWETPYIIIAINGERFKYQSDRVNELDFFKGEIVKVKLLIRTKTDNVWRFNLLDRFDI